MAGNLQKQRVVVHEQYTGRSWIHDGFEVAGEVWAWAGASVSEQFGHCMGQRAGSAAEEVIKHIGAPKRCRPPEPALQQPAPARGGRSLWHWPPTPSVPVPEAPDRTMPGRNEAHHRESFRRGHRASSAPLPASHPCRAVADVRRAQRSGPGQSASIKRYNPTAEETPPMRLTIS